MNYRILFVGVPRIEGLGIEEFKQAKDEETYHSSDLLRSPTLYDYDIIFLHERGLGRVFELMHKDINKYSEYKMMSEFEKVRNEFQRFLSMVGALVVFPIGTIPERVFPTSLPEIEEKEGEVIKINHKHPLSVVLGRFEFNWLWHLKDSYPENLVIAKNNPGLAVSYEVVLDSGAKVFFLPNLVHPQRDLVKFLRAVLNVIESNYMQHKGLVEEPEWIGQYLLPSEENLRKEVTEKEKQLGVYKSLKELLYYYGDHLSYSVYLVFRRMGFDADWKEHKGRHDVEVKFRGPLGIVEVKGLKGSANIDDVRQLLDHYVGQVKGGKDVKGIFVLNHFRDVEPKSRGEPFTKDAIRLAEDNGFCLMTTVDLFGMLGRFLKGELDTTEIAKLLLRARGKITT